MVNPCKYALKAGGVLLLSVWVSGCTTPRIAKPLTAERPDVSPKQSAGSEHTDQLGDPEVQPMVREVLAVDLPTVVRVAEANSLAVLQAREQVKASTARVESAKGRLLPSLVPRVSYEDIQGAVRATEGNLVDVGIQTLQASIAVQWVLNPGKVKYDIIAAQKRSAATEQHERTVETETLRKAATQYYAMVLAQTRVAAAKEAVSEAEELLRVNQLHQRTGTGVPADVSRAKAHLAQQQQGLLKAVNVFYAASIDLSVTLHLDATVTLVPKIRQLSPVVRYTQDGKLYGALMPKAHQQLSAAEEAHRLIQAGFDVGTATLLDVLQSQETLAAARVQ